MKYKISGIEYIENIPVHWTIRRNFELFSERIERGYTKEELLSITISRGVIKQTEITLLAHAKTHGVGKRYLVQHSAGSGKSNSITWLAHQLTGLHDQEGINPVFRSIVVVTDRTVLDEQIQENIKNFAHVKNVVEAMTGKGESKTGQ